MTNTKPKPSPEQLAAIEAFRVKNGRHWKERLSTAWATGRDEREPNGHLLRQVRNNFGPEWLQSYQPVKQETVYSFPPGFERESGQTMWGRLTLQGFHPQWVDGVSGISLPADEVPALRALQMSTPRTWGNHPDVDRALKETPLNELHVIYSPNESASSDGAGFWSNEDGWVLFDAATKFTTAERDSLNLPIATGQDAKWVSESEAAAAYAESELGRAGIDTLSPAIDHLIRDRS